MTIYRNLIKMRMSQPAAAHYTPSQPGIDIVYHDFNKDDKTIMAELACSDKILPLKTRLDGRHISDELNHIQNLHRGKYEILKENIDRFNYPKSPKFIMRVNGWLDDPHLGSDLYHKAKDKQNILIQDTQLKYLNYRRKNEGIKPIQSRDQTYLPAKRTFPNNSPHYKHGDNDLENKKELYHVMKQGEIDRG